MLASSNDQQEATGGTPVLPLSRPATPAAPPSSTSSSRRLLGSVAAVALLAVCAAVGTASHYRGSRAAPTAAADAAAGAAATAIAPDRILAKDDVPPPKEEQEQEDEDDDDEEAYGGSLIAQQFGPDPYASRDKMRMILDGELSLVDVRYSPSSFSKDSSDGDGHDDTVWCDFCKMDWSLHANDPSRYPSVRDVMGQSTHCIEHRYSFPCETVITAVREHDADSATSTNPNKVRPVPVTGILLHEGRSGATVISNALAAAEPSSIRVIAEHPAPQAILAACDSIKNKHSSGAYDCDPTKQVALLKDVVMLLSRTSDPNLTKLYLKMHASGSVYIDLIRQAFPDSKWGFVYRDAGVALSKATQRKRDSCAKQKRSPSSALRAYADANGVDLGSASAVEVCSMHLATLVRSALAEHEKTGTGRLIDYDEELKHSGSGSGASTDNAAIVDSILPYFGVDTTNDKADGSAAARGRVLDVVKMDANAGHTGRRWDAAAEEEKELGASRVDSIRNAAERYVQVDTMDIARARG